MTKRLERGVNEADPGDDQLFAQWQDKLHLAIARTQDCSSRKGALIEVAAQHPLVDGIHPNPEFSARLDMAIEVYGKLKTRHSDVCIYVPGSIHMDGGKVDVLSLSEAGCNYLIEHGLPADVLYGDNANREFKGEVGVYNSSDECYVASRLFERLQFGELHCVCSPAQLLRKALSYIEFGYMPYMHSVPCDEMYHSYVDEAFLYIPRLLNDGHGLQSSSVEAGRLRALRKPQL